MQIIKKRKIESIDPPSPISLISENISFSKNFCLDDLNQERINQLKTLLNVKDLNKNAVSTDINFSSLDLLNPETWFEILDDKELAFTFRSVLVPNDTLIKFNLIEKSFSMMDNDDRGKINLLKEFLIKEKEKKNFTKIPFFKSGKNSSFPIFIEKFKLFLNINKIKNEEWQELFFSAIPENKKRKLLKLEENFKFRGKSFEDVYLKITEELDDISPFRYADKLFKLDPIKIPLTTFCYNYQVFSKCTYGNINEDFLIKNFYFKLPNNVKLVFDNFYQIKDIKDISRFKTVTEIIDNTKKIFNLIKNNNNNNINNSNFNNNNNNINNNNKFNN